MLDGCRVHKICADTVDKTDANRLRAPRSHQDLKRRESTRTRESDSAIASVAIVIMDLAAEVELESALIE